jgi:curved DNA-binding protein CbpA
VSSDYYAILGVSPAAEDVVIGAAYRALMRHYHPDTNPDPAAQDRAREITAAYAVLRDPGNRAAYDAGRAAGLDSLDYDEPGRPPPMRAASIVSAVLALGLVAAVWAWPRPDPPDPGSHLAASKRLHPAAESAPQKPPTHLEPESERLAKLAASTAPPPEPVAPIALPEPEPEPLVAAPRARPTTGTLARASVPPPRRKAVAEARRPAPEMPKAIAPAPPADAQSARLATLDRLSAGFFSQSMVHASDDKKQLLLAARDRSAARRKACHSDSCIADTYLRQIRQTSAIMERPPETPK